MIWQMFQFQYMMEKPRPDLLTLSTTFYTISQARNLFSTGEMPQFGASGINGLICHKSEFIPISISQSCLDK